MTIPGQTRRRNDTEYGVPIDTCDELRTFVRKARKAVVKLTVKRRVVAVMLHIDNYLEISDKLEAIKRQESEEPVETLENVKRIHAEGL